MDADPNADPNAVVNGGDGGNGDQNNATIADLQHLLHQVISIQHGSAQQAAARPAPPAVRSDRAKAKPERPTIKQNSSDGDWRLFLD